MSKAIADRVFKRVAKKSQDDVPPDFQGNPETHGIDEPRGGGFSIMQKLQKDLVKEEDKILNKKAKDIRAIEARVADRVITSSVHKARDWWKDEVWEISSALGSRNYIEAVGRLGELYSSFGNAHGLDKIIRQAKNLLRDDKTLADRAANVMDSIEQWERDVVNAGKRACRTAVKQAMYWCGPDRTYRLTKDEQSTDKAVCPRCKALMEKEKFTRSEKLYRCPGCGFKVPTGKVTTQKIEIEIDQDGEVEIELSREASMKKAGIKHGIITKNSGDERKMLKWLADLDIMTRFVSGRGGKKAILVGEEIYGIKTKRGRTVIDALEQMERQGKIELLLM